MSLADVVLASALGKTALTIIIVLIVIGVIIGLVVAGLFRRR